MKISAKTNKLQTQSKKTKLTGASENKRGVGLDGTFR